MKTKTTKTKTKSATKKSAAQSTKKSGGSDTSGWSATIGKMVEDGKEDESIVKAILEKFPKGTKARALATIAFKRERLKK